MSRHSGIFVNETICHGLHTLCSIFRLTKLVAQSNDCKFNAFLRRSLIQNQIEMCSPTPPSSTDVKGIRPVYQLLWYVLMRFGKWETYTENRINAKHSLRLEVRHSRNLDLRLSVPDRTMSSCFSNNQRWEKWFRYCSLELGKRTKCKRTIT